MNSNLLGFISACTALIATIIGPYVAMKTARSQINANVLSTNRAKWIETMRELISSTISQLTGYMILRAHLHERTPAIIATTPELLGRIERGAQTISKIRLMINPEDSDNQKLVETLDLALNCLRSQDDQSLVDRQIEAYKEEIVRQSQAILKQEWIRVKKGT
jgi:hypothetical protein